MDETFEPLTDEEIAAFTSLVWDSWAIGEITEAEAANMLLHEAWVNGQFEA